MIEQQRFAVEPWTVRVNELDLSALGQTESVFALANGHIGLRGNLDELSDEEIHDHLIPIRGIGTWTAQMFLIFSLGRLDVLPVGDLGLRSAVQEVFKLDDMPLPKIVTELAEPWRPYRSIATWYLWRSKGAVPQSK